MTRAEIHVMAPGQATDALVAERVMGWTQRNTHAGPHWYDGGVPTARGATFQDEASGLWLGWQPSVKISDAWEVVEALSARRRNLVLNDGTRHPPTYEIQDGLDENGAWTYCAFEMEDGSWRSVRGATAALTICRAALLTTLSEEEYAEGRRWTDGTRVQDGKLVRA